MKNYFKIINRILTTSLFFTLILIGLLSTPPRSFAADSCGVEPVETCGTESSSTCDKQCESASNFWNCYTPCTDAYIAVRDTWQACHVQFSTSHNQYLQCTWKQRDEEAAEQQRQAQLKQQTDLEKSSTPKQTTTNTSNTSTPKPEIVIKTLVVGEDIKEGDTVTTGKNERTIIVFPDGSKIQINGDSSFSFTNKNEGKTLKGKIYLFFEKLVKGKTYTVTTPNSTCSIRGTKFSVETKKNKTIVNVTEGVVAVSDTKKKKTVNVKAGYKISVNGKSIGKATRLKTSDSDTDYDQFNK